MHETMHSLGINHMHERPDRDDYVKVLWHNINPKRYDLFAIANNKNYTR